MMGKKEYMDGEYKVGAKSKKSPLLYAI